MLKPSTGKKQRTMPMKKPLEKTATNQLFTNDHTHTHTHTQEQTVFCNRWSSMMCNPVVQRSGDRASRFVTVVMDYLSK